MNVTHFHKQRLSEKNGCELGGTQRLSVMTYFVLLQYKLSFNFGEKFNGIYKQLMVEGFLDTLPKSTKYEKYNLEKSACKRYQMNGLDLIFTSTKVVSLYPDANTY